MRRKYKEFLFEKVFLPRIVKCALETHENNKDKFDGDSKMAQIRDFGTIWVSRYTESQYAMDLFEDLTKNDEEEGRKKMRVFISGILEGVIIVKENSMPRWIGTQSYKNQTWKNVNRTMIRQRQSPATDLDQ